MNHSDDMKTHGLTYVVVWAVLVALLLLNMAAGKFFTGLAGLAINISIASLQAVLALSFFMQLKYEKGLLRIIVPLAVVIIMILMGLVFSDVGYR